jgi:hypothetical protein
MILNAPSLPNLARPRGRDSCARPLGLPRILPDEEPPSE